jgi:uncharacterized protein (DUF342 family)
VDDAGRNDVIRGKAMPEPSRLTIRISGDGLSAFLTVLPGPAAGVAELEEALTKSAIVATVSPEIQLQIVESLADPSFACEDEPLVQGQPAQPGQDAWLELGFSHGIQPGHVRDDGTFDYLDREQLKPVRHGDILGVVHDERAGVPGRTLSGNIISVPPAKPLLLQFLAGVELCSDATVRATRDGVVLYKPAMSLDVVDHHIHQGPVDLHSGNLHMQGSLVIHGDVKRPFSVVATGDVEIVGSIDSSCVRAGGRLAVRGGTRGGEGGAVYAEGDISIRHAESADVHSGGLVALQESVHCRILAERVVVSGRLRGGSVVAESQIIIKEAGARNGTDTRLTVGEPLSLPVIEAQRFIATQKTARLSERVGGRSHDRSKGGKLGRVRVELQTKEVQRLAERALRRSKLLETASVQVNLAHPGVSIRIGKAEVTLDDVVKSTRFVLDRESANLRSERTT